MKEEHGLDVFFGGCPVCKELCCCNNKSVFCHRKNHCYRKCPATKTNGKAAGAAAGGGSAAVKDDSDSEPVYQEEHLNSIPKPENGQYGIFDLLAAVADMDKSNPTLGKKTANPSSSGGTNVPRKKAKVAKEASSVTKHGFPSNMLLCEPSFTPYYSSSGAAGLPESVSNLQLLHNSKQSPNLTGTSQMSLSGDSGVDGYTFNNNTMGIIRGGINGVDAITLMGQQKQKYSSLDKLSTIPLSTENLLSGIAATNSAVPASSASTLNSGSATTGSSIYNRLPSIDANPFSAAGTKDAGRVNATFDQALLDSVRNIQADSNYHLALGPLGQPLPSVPRSLNQAAAGIASGDIGKPSTAATASGASTSAAAEGKSGYSAPNAAALEPMNLLALVSSFTQSLDKNTLSSDRLLLGGTNPATTNNNNAEAKAAAAAKAADVAPSKPSA